MAAFRHIANQVFNKAAIEAKYKGTLDDFKKEFNWGSLNDQEDDYLLVISKMNFDELDGDDCFIQSGLELNDFAYILRIESIETIHNIYSFLAKQIELLPSYGRYNNKKDCYELFRNFR